MISKTPIIKPPHLKQIPPPLSLTKNPKQEPHITNQLPKVNTDY